MVWSMMFNAFLFAFFYTSLAKSSSRGIQVLFSNKAIVSTEGDQVRLQIRIYDLDPTHPVVEAHVRLYAWTKHRPVPRPLRMLQPNDELGSLLYMSMPTVATHHIDAYSMLHPTNNVEYPVDPSGLVVRALSSRLLSNIHAMIPNSVRMQYALKAETSRFRYWIERRMYLSNLRRELRHTREAS